MNIVVILLSLILSGVSLASETPSHEVSIEYSAWTEQHGESELSKVCRTAFLFDEKGNEKSKCTMCGDMSNDRFAPKYINELTGDCDFLLDKK